MHREARVAHMQLIQLSVKKPLGAQARLKQKFKGHFRDEETSLATVQLIPFTDDFHVTENFLCARH